MCMSGFGIWRLSRSVPVTMLQRTKTRGRPATTTERWTQVIFGERAMSAPLTKSQMAFELPRLSYIDTRWEEPDAAPADEPVRKPEFRGWFAAAVAAFRKWRENERAMSQLVNMSDRELFDVGLNRGDFDRIFDDRYNRDLRSRKRAN